MLLPAHLLARIAKFLSCIGTLVHFLIRIAFHPSYCFNNMA